MNVTFFAQALAEYGATAVVAETLIQVSFRLGHTIGEWRAEAIVALVAAAVLWKVLTAAR
jgi:hypothetical protein